MGKMNLEQPNNLLDEEQDDEDQADEADLSPEEEEAVTVPLGSVAASFGAATKPAGSVPTIQGKSGDIPVGIIPKGTKREDLKEKLYKSLLDRMDPNSEQNQRQMGLQKDLREQQGNNEVIAALNKAAAMAGSVGGKYADTSSVDAAAKSFNKSAADDVANLSGQQSQRDKLNEYLLSQMNAQDINASKIANQQDMLGSKIQGQKDVAGIRTQGLKDLLASKLGASQQVAAGKTDQGNVKLDNTDAQKLSGALKGSSRDAIGNNTQRVNAAQRVEALIDSVPGGNLDKRQMRELATSVGALLAGGNMAAQSQIDELVPKTFQGNREQLEEYFTGIPQGVEQQAFVRRMRDTVEREKEVASEQLKSARAGVLSGYSRLRKSNPDVWNDIAAQNGFNPESDFDDRGRFISKPAKATAGVSSSQGLNSATAAPGASQKMDPKVSSYAQAHGMDYQTARNLLKNRGYQPNE